MEIIESFQVFKNLADRTFRGRSLGYQDELEPEVDVAERSNAWRYEEKSFRGPPLALRSNHVGYGPIATEWRVTTS